MDRELLVLDDDELVGAYVRRVAELIGLPCRTVATAAAFVECLAARPPTDVVLDLQLDSADGVEMLRVLAARRSKARIVLLSGFDARVLASARDLGLELGLDIRHAMTKPVRAPALKAALQLGELAPSPISAAERLSKASGGASCCSNISRSPAAATARWRASRRSAAGGAAASPRRQPPSFPWPKPIRS